MIARFKNFKTKVNLGFIGIEGTWEVDEVQRNAAWEMYVELVTRISVVELKENEGILREALNSLHSIFGTTRNILKKYGPSIANPTQESDTTFGHIAIGILNNVLRPLLAKWHPLLTEYEHKKSDNISQIEHEKNWSKSMVLRNEINNVRKKLTEYADVLAVVSGVKNLHN